LTSGYSSWGDKAFHILMEMIGRPGAGAAAGAAQADAKVKLTDGGGRKWPAYSSAEREFSAPTRRRPETSPPFSSFEFDLQAAGTAAAAGDVNEVKEDKPRAIRPIELAGNARGDRVDVEGLVSWCGR